MNQQESTPEILQEEHTLQQNAEGAAPPAAVTEKTTENAFALEGTAPQQEEAPQPKDANAEKCLKERLYDKVNVPIWVLDLVIGGCILAIIYCLIVGRG